ncbi:MAG: Maf family protein [Planctomycetota bacterium]|jgi:septum formation protein
MADELAVSIVLASTSPRRKELLAEAGYIFTVVAPDIDESGFEAERIEPCAYAKRLALAKARRVAGDFRNALVIAADTVVDFDGEIIGKPADAKEAEGVTRKLFSKPHKVVTAVAIVRLEDSVKLVESDTTTIYPKKMSEEQMAEHIRSGSWRGKAGAYAIQEAGDEFIEKIDGSLTNVMGLPMELLERMLREVL